MIGRLGIFTAHSCFLQAADWLTENAAVSPSPHTLNTVSVGGKATREHSY